MPPLEVPGSWLLVAFAAVLFFATTAIIGIFWSPFKAGIAAAIEALAVLIASDSLGSINATATVNFKLGSVLQFSSDKVLIQIGSVSDDWYLSGAILSLVFIVSSIGVLAEQYIKKLRP